MMMMRKRRREKIQLSGFFFRIRVFLLLFFFFFLFHVLNASQSMLWKIRILFLWLSYVKTKYYRLNLLLRNEVFHSSSVLTCLIHSSWWQFPEHD